MSDQPGCTCSIHHLRSDDLIDEKQKLVVPEIESLSTRIAAVLRLHQWRVPPHESGLICSCGMEFGPHHTFDCHREHVADAVIRELALRQELWVTKDPVKVRQSWGKPPVHRRYVTEWADDE